MMTSPVKAATGSRWKNIVLIISLAINLLVAGAVIAAVSNFGNHHRGKFRHSFMIPGQFLKQLPEQRRNELLVKDNTKHLTRRERHEKMKQMRTQLADAVAADPYDASKVEEIFLGLKDFYRFWGDKSIDRDLKLIVKLTPSERQAYAQALRQRSERRGKWFKRWRKHKDGE